MTNDEWVKEAEVLAARLRKLAPGRAEWRVQHPVDKCYCMSFDHSDSINPERAAREWLADFQRLWPEHDHAKYEVAEVRSFSDLERAALNAAAHLSARPAPQAALSEEEILELARREGDECKHTFLFNKEGRFSVLSFARAVLAASRQVPVGWSNAAHDVLAERARQVSAEGWTPEHDDQHRNGAMAVAAACYALQDCPSVLAVAQGTAGVEGTPK